MALAGEPPRRNLINQPRQPRPVELFKIHLGRVSEDNRLPIGVTPTTDYLREANSQTFCSSSGKIVNMSSSKQLNDSKK
jgi:hypothetical protein